jgi:gluconokinase
MTTEGRRPPLVVVAGVSGSGKSTVGRQLAAALELPFAEGDDFHSPANIAKMAAGQPLSEADRAPWLAAIAAWLRRQDEQGTGGVIACSALRRRYRDELRAAAPDLRLIMLAGDPARLRSRLTARTGHFMPAKLLESQLATFEPLGAEEHGLTLNVADPLTRLLEQARTWLDEPA